MKNAEVRKLPKFRLYDLDHAEVFADALSRKDRKDPRQMRSGPDHSSAGNIRQHIHYN